MQRYKIIGTFKDSQNKSGPVHTFTLTTPKDLPGRTLASTIMRWEENEKDIGSRLSCRGATFPEETVWKWARFVTRKTSAIAITIVKEPNRD